MRLLLFTFLLLSSTFAQFAKKQADGSVLVTVPLLIAKSPKGFVLDNAAFKVFEDGKEAKVVSIAAAPDDGVAVAMLLDQSNSQNAVFRSSRRFIIDLVSQLFRPGKDAFAGGVFDTKLQFQPLTTDKTAVTKIFEKAVAGGGTALFDAVVGACKQLSIPPRTADMNVVLIVVSDGQDNQSVSNLADAVGEAQRSNVTVISIYPSFSTSLERGEQVMMRLAHSTGGMFVRVTENAQLEEAINKLFDQLHRRLLVTYVSPNTSTASPHEVEMKVVDKKLKILVSAGRFDPIN